MVNQTLNIMMISNITFEPFFTPQTIKQFEKNTSIKQFFVPYENFNASEYRKLFLVSDYIIVWINMELLYPNIQIEHNRIFNIKNHIDEIDLQFKKLLKDVTSCTNAKVFCFSFEKFFYLDSIVAGHIYESFIDKLNYRLFNTLKDFDTTFIDLNHLIAEIGIVNSYDLKNKYHWNVPYSKMLIETAIK